ncbi:MAG: four helix bundle protein, partial [Okeania sp. SIO2H7]|nr:four helix bundle protein [Okeania sp. SIO2H7]
MTSDFVVSHRELLIYETGLEAAMKVFEVVQSFPDEERLLLTDQVLRSSRSVCANVAEAWCKRRYKKAFVAKLNEVEAEAAETQTWVELAILCGYLDAEVGQELFHQYSRVLAAAGRMIE